MKLPKVMLVLSAVVILSALGGGPALASRGGGGGGGGPETPEPVNICHLDQGVYTLLPVDPDEVAAHLAHGDVNPDNGHCPVSQPDPQPVNICHNEQGAYNLIAVDPDEVAAHLAHGDVNPENGGCPSDPVVEVAGTTDPVVEPVVEAVAEPVADGPVAQPVVEAQVTLPRTGVDTAQQSLIGLVLVGAGLLLLALRRRTSAADPA